MTVAASARPHPIISPTVRLLLVTHTRRSTARRRRRRRKPSLPYRLAMAWRASLLADTPAAPLRVAGGRRRPLAPPPAQAARIGGATVGGVL